MLHPLIGALCSLTDPRQGPQWLALLLGAWLALGVPTRAFAQDLAPPPTTQAEVEASQQVAEGERLRAAGQYQEALARYRAAYRLHPSEAPLRAAAEVYRLLGDHASAYTAYETLLRRHYAALSETAERSARQALAGLQPLTATIAVERFAPGATIAINGIVIGKTPLPGVARVNPGRYTVTVARPGYEILTRVLQLTSGARRALRRRPPRGEPTLAGPDQSG
jgi:tetratricopeptide (TPR) repeat protein